MANLFKKANNKLRALARAAPYMTTEKRKVLMNSFFNVHLRLILRLIHCDKNSSYEELLEKNGSVSIHHRNIQNLAIEMYKVKNELAPMITANVFTKIPENHYNLHSYNDFRLPFARTVYHGTKNISYLGPKIWNIVTIELKNAQSFNSFKKFIKKGIPNNCPGRLCKRYLDGVGCL